MLSKIEKALTYFVRPFFLMAIDDWNTFLNMFHRVKAPNASQRRLMYMLRKVSGVEVYHNPKAATVANKNLRAFAGMFCQGNKLGPIKNDTIFMNCDANDPQWYRVLFHELAHATGSSKRLNRMGLARGRTLGTYAYEEIIAETVALELSETYGFSSPQLRKKSIAYIDMYRRQLVAYAGQGDILGALLLHDSPDAFTQRVADAKSMVLDWLNQVETMGTKQ